MSYSPIIDINAIKLNVANFIQAVVQQTGQGPAGGGPFTWNYAWQESVKLLKPYVNFKVTGPRRVGSLDEIRPEPMYDDDGNVVTDGQGNALFGQRDLEGEREYTVSIECCSDDEVGPMLAATLQTALQAPQYASILEAGGAFSVRNINPLMDVTQYLDMGTKYERRSVLDFVLGAVSSMKYDVTQITKASGQIEGVPPAGTPIEIPLTAKYS